MGGGAFAELHCPRMPLPVYQAARQRALEAISTIYSRAECPIEAPGKVDYGDIDILVDTSSRSAGIEGDLTTLLTAALGAVQHKTTRNNPTTNFAIPWPAELQNLESFSAQDTSESSKAKPSSSGASLAASKLPPKFIQLDLHSCPRPPDYTWTIFHQAHGDLWNILGGVIRPTGLNINHDGLYIGLEGVKNLPRDQTRLKLTESPAEVLQFMRLDVKQYWSPFASQEALFDYCASCRFFDPKRYVKSLELKSNDRLRSKKRPVFRAWLEEYLPALREKGHKGGAMADVSWEQVLAEADKAFGVGAEYREKRSKALRIMGIHKLWADIRRDLPVEGFRIGVIMRGVKREVCGNIDDMDVSEMTHVQGGFVEGRFDDIAQWVSEDWEAIEERQTQFEKEKNTRNLLDKLERVRLEKAQKQEVLGESA